MSAQSNNIFTITKLNRLARTILESEIGTIWVSAEISNFVKASSGHWYFTLKDQKAQVKAAMFKGNNRRVVTIPKEGEQVLVRANISLYEPRGDYQLIVEHLELGGEGQLKQQFERLKQQLAAEGLFAQQYKQPLPAQIKRVGIVTSSTGAALHDILTVLKRRSPLTQVVIYPSQVQGQAATAQIVNAIQLANQRNEVDVLIVGRGGGSLEDLWCFNEEAVARAIYHSALPIISAVGHEVDVCISDFVADLRAPTPSAAAEIVSLDQQQLKQDIQSRLNQLYQAINGRLRHASHSSQQRLQQLQLHHPSRQLEQQVQRVDNLQLRLHNSIKGQLNQGNLQLSRTSQRLSQQDPQHQLAHYQQQLANLQASLKQRMQLQLDNKRQQLANSGHLLETVSPLATLSRGYNIAFKAGKVIKSSNELASGDKITNKFVDGEVTSIVE
ncbi:exodeoxyribonuclease VII large subunit [Alteromonadaceae bacterium BrNp21-10]|nr:exodeoxyribonuclease VII large subunit [Alteromonadaceae bacterium BrNp21-10]